MALLASENDRLIARTWLLVAVSLTPFGWLLAAAQIPGLSFETVVTGLVILGLVSMGSLAWLASLVFKLTKQVASGPEEKQMILKACLIFGQLGALWSVYHLTAKRDRST